MKSLNLIQLIGSIALLLGCVFNLTNQLCQKDVFPFPLILVLFIIAIIGIVCGIINIVKRK